MRTELRFTDDNEKSFWIEVDGDNIVLVIDEMGVPIEARLDAGLARKFRRELTRAIGEVLINRASK